MWYIQSISEADRKIVVLPGKEYVIGRKDCDIVIDNDPSVSRKHAVLKVAYSFVNTDCSSPPTLSLTDVSKFGTFINNKAVKGQKTLQHGDEIRFGLPKSAHRVVHEPLVVTMSCLDKNRKKEVRTLVSQLGGVISNDWRKDCSFLIMKTVTVTIKVVCALASQKAIVTVDYLSELHKHLKGEIAVEPKPENYLPTVTENLIRPGVSFHPTAKRSGVFIGMTFYFLSSKQFHKMNLAIELGGGVPILTDDPTSDLDAFLEANTVVMNPAPGEVTEKAQKDWVEKVRKFLLKRNKYMVQDAEVGYAVLYCSTEDYCNPDKDVSHLLSVPLASQSLSSQAVDVNSQAVGRPSQATPASQPVFKRPGPPKQDRGDISVPGTTSSVLVEEIITESETVSQQDMKGKGRGKRARSPAPFTVDSEVKVKEETLTPDHEQSSGSRSGVARRTRDRAGVETAPTGRQKRSRSRSPAPSEEDTKQQSRSRSRSPAPSEEDTSQKQARSRSPVGKRGASKKRGSAARADLEARSRSPSRTLVVPDTETSPSVTEEAKNASVKREADDGASAQISNTLTSQALFDSDLPPASKTKKEKVESLADSRPFTMLDDDDDDIIQPARKPPPARQKRKVSISSDEDDPFDFAHKKRQKGDKKSGSHGNDDDDDNQPARKPPPAKQKRKVSISSDEDDPFDFAHKKRQRAEKKSDDKDNDDDPFSIAPTKKQSKPSTSRGGDGGTRARSPGPGSRSSRSRSPAAKDQSSRSESQRARSPAAKDQGSRSSRSPSPGPKRGARSSSPTPETESVAVADREERSDLPLSRSSQNGHEGRQSYTGIRLQGWLTTCLPMAEQVTANKDFEPEDIKRPLLTVAYADLVVRTFGDRRRQQTNNTTEDTTDTATDGMVKWEGKLVRNFKKFRKTKHAQVGQLRRIIGGSDLAEHSSGSRKFLDNWLKDLQEVESQESQREKEMDALFGWQPVKSAKGKGGGGVGSRRGR